MPTPVCPRAWAKMLEEVPLSLRGDYSPEVALTHIMSPLKGSHWVLNCPDGDALYPEDVLPKGGPGREHTYLPALHCAYEQYKRQHHMFDHFDIVRHVHRQWLLEGPQHQPPDLIHVDIVEELT